MTLIEQYKTRINNLQTAYDEDMEAAENMVQVTVNKVNKCKEDLKMQMDKVEMFHKKIKEVRDKLAAEAEKERARLSAVSNRKNTPKKNFKNNLTIAGSAFEEDVQNIGQTEGRSKGGQEAGEARENASQEGGQGSGQGAGQATGQRGKRRPKSLVISGLFALWHIQYIQYIKYIKYVHLPNAMNTGIKINK